MVRAGERTGAEGKDGLRMSKKELFGRRGMSLRLQHFAEPGDGAGADGSNGGGTDGSNGGNGTDGNGADGSGKGGNEPPSFDELLQGGHQAEFDRRVQKAIDTALTKAQEKWRALTDDKLTEAEKLAKMTKEEKAEYKTKKLEKELSDLKRQNALSDMSKTARKMLGEKGISIPEELLPHLVSDDAEGTKKAIESFAGLFKDSVSAAVKDALKGPTPKAGMGGNAALTKEQIMAIKNPSERQRMIAENITLFQ